MTKQNTSNCFIAEILKNSNMTNIEQGVNIYHLLSQVVLLNIPGEVVELGCHEGLTAAVMQKTLDQFQSKKELHLYDSFEGLPSIHEKDGNTPATAGLLKTEKEKVIATFNRSKLKQPKIHAGWFKDTLPMTLPKEICFAHLDGDVYTSIIESLEGIYPRLKKGAIVVIDDYYDEKIHPEIEHALNTNLYNKHFGIQTTIPNLLPGVKQACDEFFKDKPEQIVVLIASCERHAYFRKE